MAKTFHLKLFHFFINRTERYQSNHVVVQEFHFKLFFVINQNRELECVLKVETHLEDIS